MSRIGKLPIEIPTGVELSVNEDNLVTAKGKLGSLTLKVDSRIVLEKNGKEFLVKRNSDYKEERALHGLYRALIFNMVEGVSKGYEKSLEVIGVGYRAAVTGTNVLELSLGHSHPYFFVVPDGISVEVDTKSGKNLRIILKGSNKELVGQVAAKIRSLRAPEPYKGKGVRYLGEKVRRKAGKSAGK